MDYLSNLKQDYFKRFKTNPYGIFYSPGRVNIIGEHQDYNNGLALPMAIQNGIYVAIGGNDDGLFQVYSQNYSEFYYCKLDDVQKNTTWRNYPLSAINELVKKGHKLSGFNLVIGGDLLVGMGISASAALLTAIVFALNDFFKLNLSLKELVLLAQAAEHGYPGVNCGILDQTAILFAKKNQCLLLDCKDFSIRNVPWEPADKVLVLFDSGVKHSLATSAYNERRRECVLALSLLNSNFNQQNKDFRDFSISDLNSIKDKMEPNLYKRAKYVIEEFNRTSLAVGYLRHGHYEKLGALLSATHEGLSKYYEVSCDELDEMVKISAKHKSVLGSRIMGGGFGGCSINLMEAENWQKTADQIMREYYRIYGLGKNYYIAESSQGTHRIE